MYMGIIGLVFAFASSIGPILGGVFTQTVSWRWCFYVNLPCDGLACILIILFLDLETPSTPLLAGLKAVDWLGSLLIVGATVTFLLGLGFGNVTFPWGSATIICLLVFTFLILALFVFVEARIAKYPIMPLRILSKRSNIAALATNFFHGLVFIAGAYFLPLYFQAVLGATPLLSGVYLLPFALSLSCLATGSGIFIRKTGQYLPPIWLGMALMSLGFGLFISFSSSPSWARIVVFQIIAGVGVGCLFQSPLVALQSHVAPSDIATVTATFGFTRNLSAAVSVVVGGAIFQNQMATRVAAKHPHLPQKIIDALSGGVVGGSTSLASDLSPKERSAVLNIYT